MYKQCEIVLLPTDKAGIGTIMKCIKQMPFNVETKINTLTTNGNWKVAETNGNEYWQPYHLYVLSDDEIKPCDWYVNNKVLFKADDKFDEGNNPNQNPNNKKIIATADKSLKLFIDGNGNQSSHELTKSEYIIFLPIFLPQPSESFIKKYVEEYNKGNIITEVMIEYETIQTTKKEDYQYFGNHKSNLNYVTQLKINSDNTINIKSLKDSWSREEVESLLFNLAEHYAMTSTKNEIEDFNKWIKKNL